MNLDAKEAVRRAKAYVAELYSDEAIRHPGVEEIKYDDSQEVWNITIGFFREWDAAERTFGEAIAGQSALRWDRRTFKVVTVDGESGDVRAMTHRVFSLAE